ncbi:FBP C-terminal treble-clef zinc-finger [Halobacillus dabanensis]|uniref:FBP C-terminal treble-clef zinc-finger n=1 Tax=Halobacillus dabanensis TaxID=240302 RepID=A0A1I4AXH1_HALDA|nr:FusB/FusC family EF-G-binding protein [Halobacillus dabanensis]SFK61258.1 FBP C-terminal treble-clef zinc-finger [Halobacillus dabanensis]
MEPFLEPYQYHFLKSQGLKLVNAQISSTDTNVIKAVRGIVEDSILYQFQHCAKEERQLVERMNAVKDEREVEQILTELHPFIIPFQATEEQIQKLFPKVKKLKVPDLDFMNTKQITYLTWWDPGTHKKFIVTVREGKQWGVYGTFQKAAQKGICSICGRHEKTGLFLVERKGKEIGTYKKKGNYICSDGEACNQNLTRLDKLDEFLARLSR